MLRALMYILPLALTIYAFIDCLNTPEEDTKHLPKVVWVIIILLFWFVGPIVWLFAGKRRRAAPAGGFRGGSKGGGWVAPDDNPEFLKSLKKDQPADEPVDRPTDGSTDGPTLSEREAELNRREEELRKRERDLDEGTDKS
ncbi:PLD nuclease N-terminal domain-containing protein [Streptomyces sp. NPDC056144]|uniref:PLD nuclease N-terminal domain-containing protein n=1 Tax=unclassified Streptomyces TaxID=2593676 RepID=UPI0035DED3C4